MGKYTTIILLYCIQFAFGTVINSIPDNLPLCSDVPLLPELCIRAGCIEHTPFGVIKRFINGWRGDRCDYSAIFNELGEVNCMIPKDEASRFSYLMRDHYRDTRKTDVVGSIKDFAFGLSRFCRNVTVLDAKKYHHTIQTFDNINKIEIGSPFLSFNEHDIQIDHSDIIWDVSRLMQ